MNPAKNELIQLLRSFQRIVTAILGLWATDWAHLKRVRIEIGLNCRERGKAFVIRQQIGVLLELTGEDQRNVIEILPHEEIQVGDFLRQEFLKHKIVIQFSQMTHLISQECIPLGKLWLQRLCDKLVVGLGAAIVELAKCAARVNHLLLEHVGGAELSWDEIVASGNVLENRQ